MSPKPANLPPAVTMRRALSDPALLGAVLAGDSWRAWRILLIAAMGEALDDDERAIFSRLTGREREPLERVDELWAIVGRRGGKSRSVAALAVYLACFRDYSSVLSIGERPIVLCLAQTAKQASVAFNYILGILESVPLLKSLIKTKSAETISLSSGVDIEIRPASFRGLRGLTCVAVIADEVAFWYTEETGSANADTEILAAVRPALATTGGPLVCISSPYSRRGEMYEAHARHFGEKGDARILVAQGASRDFNPSLPESVVARAFERDAASAAAEYGGQFRSDIESFISREAIEPCVDRGVIERPPVAGTRYSGFVDPSGGSADSFTAAVAHKQGDLIILDAVREVRPPFSPESVTKELASFFLSYKIKQIRGDKYAGLWPREQFAKAGVTYDPSAKPKSELYGELLPVINSRRVALLDDARLVSQLTALERRTSRAGRDAIDSPPSGHDDRANAVAGVIASLGSEREPGFLTYYQALAGFIPEAPDDPRDYIWMKGPTQAAKGWSGREYSSPTWDGVMKIHKSDVASLRKGGFTEIKELT